MTRVEKILLKVSEIMADKDFLRYKEDMVIRTLNEAIDNLALNTKVFRRRYFVGLEKGIVHYNLKNFLFNIDRVQFMYQVLDPKTEEQMDEIDAKWQETEGRVPTTVIFDNLEHCKFRIYPRVMENTIDIVDYNSLYGGIVDIELNDDTFFIPSKGCCDNFNKAFLIVYGAGIHKRITNITPDEDLEWPQLYDDILVYFTSGQLYRSNADGINRQLGTEQLQIYNSMINEIKRKESQANNTTLRKTSYIGFPK